MNAEKLSKILLDKVETFIKDHRIIDTNSLNISERVDFEDMITETIKNQLYDENKDIAENHAEILTISHYHLTPQVYALLDKILDNHKTGTDLDTVPIYDHYDNGLFLFINKVDVASLPKCLADVIIYARNDGYQWLAINKDAKLIDDLTTYEHTKIS